MEPEVTVPTCEVAAAAIRQILEGAGLVAKDPLVVLVWDVATFCTNAPRHFPENRKIRMSSEDLSTLTLECADVLVQQGLLKEPGARELDCLRGAICGLMHKIGLMPPDCLMSGHVDWDEVRAAMRRVPTRA